LGFLGVAFSFTLQEAGRAKNRPPGFFTERLVCV